MAAKHIHGERIQAGETTVILPRLARKPYRISPTAFITIMALSASILIGIIAGLSI